MKNCHNISILKAFYFVDIYVHYYVFKYYHFSQPVGAIHIRSSFYASHTTWSHADNICTILCIYYTTDRSRLKYALTMTDLFTENVFDT